MHSGTSQVPLKLRKDLECQFDAIFRGRVGPSGPGRHLDVLGHGQLAKDFAILGRVSDPQPRSLQCRHPRQAAVLEPDYSTLRDEVAHDRLQRGRLAGTVPAYEANEFLITDVKADTAEDLAALDLDIEIYDVKHVCPACRPRWP